jgi:hypothetical protein
MWARQRVQGSGFRVQGSGFRVQRGMRPVTSPCAHWINAESGRRGGRREAEKALTSGQGVGRVDVQLESRGQPACHSRPMVGALGDHSDHWSGLGAWSGVWSSAYRSNVGGGRIKGRDWPQVVGAMEVGKTTDGRRAAKNGAELRAGPDGAMGRSNGRDAMWDCERTVATRGYSVLSTRYSRWSAGQERAASGTRGRAARWRNEERFTPTAGRGHGRSPRLLVGAWGDHLAAGWGLGRALKCLNSRGGTLAFVGRCKWLGQGKLRRGLMAAERRKTAQN